MENSVKEKLKKHIKFNATTLLLCVLFTSFFSFLLFEHDIRSAGPSPEMFVESYYYFPIGGWSHTDLVKPPPFTLGYFNFLVGFVVVYPLARSAELTLAKITPKLQVPAKLKFLEMTKTKLIVFLILPLIAMIFLSRAFPPNVWVSRPFWNKSHPNFYLLLIQIFIGLGGTMPWWNSSLFFISLATASLFWYFVTAVLVHYYQKFSK